jgi:putative copper resistance protein D
MSDAVIAVRAVYFIAALQLFGLLTYASLFSGRVPRRTAISLASLVLFALAAWLALEAGMMNGESVGAAMSDGTLGTVLGATRFGTLWLVRVGLLLGIVVLIAAGNHGARAAATIAVGSVLVLTAATGHAGAASGPTGTVHLAADMLHLLAAGAWLGGLLPFAGAMAHPISLAQADAEARRFSRLGLVCVGTILATGGINGWFLVGTLPALVGTAYGRLLLVKIALFLAMVGIAAINRYRLTPRIRHDGAGALPALRRNSMIEAALGLGILLIVAVLGTLPPAYDVAGRGP